MLTNFFELCEIGDKAVYIVDDHHKALAAWAIERRKFATARADYLELGATRECGEELALTDRLR